MNQTFLDDDLEDIHDEMSDFHRRQAAKRLPGNVMMTETFSKEDTRSPEKKLDEKFGLDEQGIHVSEEQNRQNIINNLPHQSKYDPDYGPLLIYHMSKGYSYTSFKAVIGVDKRTLTNWEREHEEFRLCLEIAQTRMQMKWEHIILQAAEGKVKGNAAAIIFAIKNYFPDIYKDKREIETHGTVMLVDTGIKRLEGNGPQSDHLSIDTTARRLDRRRRVIDVIDDDADQL